MYHHRQLPAQIDHILNAGVHTLRAGGAVDVRSIAAQEDSALLEMVDHAAVNAKPATPAHARSRAGMCERMSDLLQFLQRRFGVLARPAQRIAGDHAKAPLAHREQAHEAMLGRENVEIRVG